MAVSGARQEQAFLPEGIRAEIKSDRLEGGDSHERIEVELEDNGSPSEAHTSLQHPTAGAGKSNGAELTAFSNTWFFPLNYNQSC